MNLPYDMGNAGDLVKHGLLAEFAQWWCKHEGGSLRFLDPFAGLPWASPPKKEVTRRIKALPRCAMRDAQPEPATRYYGSSYVVLYAARTAGCSVQVLVSDSDPRARLAFQHEAISQIDCPGFIPSDGFSILDAKFEGNLLLLDPFADFLPKRASKIIPKIAVVSERIATVLFVLNQDPENAVGQRYQQLRSQFLAGAWSICCPKLPNRGVAGESKHEVEVVLAWRRLVGHPARLELRNKLKTYAQSLSGVLNTRIMFRIDDQDIHV